MTEAASMEFSPVPGTSFLPVCREDMQSLGWDEADFLMISGDAYVDHPSFGPAVRNVSRLSKA